MRVNRFLMPIGDWSSDGHGKCDYFTVETTNTLEEVREAHFNLPVNIEGFCECYEQDSITANEFEEAKPYLTDETVSAVEGSKTFDDNSERTFLISSYTLAMIWTDLLNNSNQGVSLTLLPQEELETIPFFGHDDKGRRIRGVGYGLFH